MPTFTKHLNLRKPEENDFYNQETEQCENWDKLDNWSEEIDNKTIGATSEAPGIVKYGTDVSTALEGHRMAQIQGVEKCGGDVQTPGVKKVGYSYWCTANKDFYVCKVENSLNYIDDAYFDAFSNYSLLGKLQNLITGSLYRGQNDGVQTVLRIGNTQIVTGSYMHDGSSLGITYPAFKGFPTLILTPWVGTEGLVHIGRNSTSATLSCSKGPVRCDVLIIGEAP